MPLGWGVDKNGKVSESGFMVDGKIGQKRGKLEVQQRRGEQMPLGWGVDENDKVRCKKDKNKQNKGQQDGERLRRKITKIQLLIHNTLAINA